jgi:hypothetical protein
VAAYMVDLATHFEQLGYRKIELFLDRNSTHKKKMQGLYRHLAQQKGLAIEVNFHLMAAYSPKLNLVEYAIHLIRQQILHHADYRKSLNQFVKEVTQLCKNGHLLSKEQIINVLDHIQGLVLKNKKQSAERE